MNTPPTASDPRFEAAWNAAQDWPAWLETVQDKRDVWEANARRASVRPDEAARLSDLPGARRVLVLTEDWCGDAARSVPVIAKALAAAPQVSARYLSLDEQPEAVAPYLTHGGRAIPIAIVQDEHGRELGAWGPRPAPLQALFRARRRELGAPDPPGMAAFYAPIMAWYGKDEGVTTVQELLMLLERGGTPR
jgi:hypothetical protein